MRALVLAFVLVLPPAAAAQTITAPGASSADLAALQALIPQPSNITPSTEVSGGAVGTDVSMYALANHQHPRISRSPQVITGAGGAFSGTFPAGFFASKPTLTAIPEQDTAADVHCKLRTVTTTTFAGLCFTDASAVLNLSIVTTGLSVGPVTAPAGITVHIIALPSS